jgi:glycosyltransferase involved in cell wall biosynthesis
MVGTHPATMGGISTVVRGYMQAGLLERYSCVYVPMHRDGTALQKTRIAFVGYLRILAYLLTRDTPLLHIHVSSRASFWRKSIVCQMARFLRRPYILHVHGSEFMQFYADECGSWARRFIGSVFDAAALVLALSDQWRDNLLKISPRASIEVLPNAVSLPDVGESTINKSMNQEVLFVGRLGPRKGIYDLLNAFARIAPRFPRAHLICAGDGEIDETRSLSNRLGIDDQVECTGWLSTQQTQERFASASIFVLPSYAEGVPMAMLEAMAWNLPIIATPVGGISQVVRSEENGLLVRPGDVDGLADALSRLLREPATRERLGFAARKTIEQSFTLDAAVERLGRIYHRFEIPAVT